MGTLTIIGTDYTETYDDRGVTVDRPAQVLSGFGAPEETGIRVSHCVVCSEPFHTFDGWEDELCNRHSKQLYEARNGKPWRHRDWMNKGLGK